MVTINAQYETKKEDYTFQHKYRSKSIQSYFYKEMMWAAVVFWLSFQIWSDYNEFFREKEVYYQQRDVNEEDPNLGKEWYMCNEQDDICYGNENYGFVEIEITAANRKEMTTRLNRLENKEQHEQDVKDNLDKFRSYWFIQYGISGVLVLNYVYRQYFNLFAKNSNTIILDYFITLDLIFAIFSAIVYSHITSHDHKALMNTTPKNKLDWVVALVKMLLQMRLFVLFLVVPSVSKMLLTLIEMLKDVKSFFILMIAYIVACAQIFQTLFQDVNENYSTFHISLRSTYDTMIGNYGYAGSLS